MARTRFTGQKVKLLCKRKKSHKFENPIALVEVEGKRINVKEYITKLKYDSEYHPALVLKCMSEGMSISETYLEFGTSPKVIDKWRKEHEEFADAFKQGMRLCKAYWERIGRLNLYNRSFNNYLYFMHMTNRFRWGSKVDVESKGGPYRQDNMVINVANTTNQVNSTRVLEVEDNVERTTRIIEELRKIGALPEFSTGERTAPKTLVSAKKEAEKNADDSSEAGSP